MYSQEVKDKLFTRIGWAAPQEPSFVLELTTDNLKSDSGIKANSFHQLVTVENIYAAIVDKTADATKFNSNISEIRKEAVLTVLTLILDFNIEYVPDTDYSSDIEKHITLFDHAIGYKMAMMVLELFMSSSRSNLLERNTRLSISNLKLEVEGYRSETTGRLMSQGISQKLNNSIAKASRKIFPIVPTVTSKSIW